MRSDHSVEELLDLMRRSWRDNTRAGLTGRIHHRGGRIRQTIEGRGDVVLALSARILADPRHGAIEIEVFGPIAARRYSGWSVEGFEPREQPASGSTVRPALRLVAGDPRSADSASPCGAAMAPTLTGSADARA